MNPLALHLALSLATAGPAAPPSGSLDFDLMPEAKLDPTEEAHRRELVSQLETRRTMLELHQGFGIAAAATMVATVIVGQLNYSDKFAGSNTGQFELAHDYLEAATVMTFLTAGALALFAPVPIEKKKHGFDSMTLHQVSMIVATAGFVAEVVLGILTVSQEGKIDQLTLANTHLAVGYATAAAMTTGVTALVFP